MSEIITTLHPDNDDNINLYPNVKKENIPNKSIDRSKLGDDVNSLLNSINELKPSGTDTSTHILAFTYNRGIYIGTDTGEWYYWNGTSYVSGGLYQSSGVADNTITTEKIVNGAVNNSKLSIDSVNSNNIIDNSVTPVKTNFLDVDSTNKLRLSNNWFKTGTNGTYIANAEGLGNDNYTFTLNDDRLNITNFVSTGYTWLSQFIELDNNTDYYLPYINISYKIVGLSSKDVGTTGTPIKAVNQPQHAGVMNSGNYNYYMISFYGVGDDYPYINKGTLNLGYQYSQYSKIDKDRISLDVELDDMDAILKEKIETAISLSNTQWTGKKVSAIGTSLTMGGGWTDIVKTKLSLDKLYNRGLGGTTITDLSDYQYSTPYYPRAFVYSDTSGYDESANSVFSPEYVSGTYAIDSWYSGDGRINVLPYDSDLVIVEIGTNDFYRIKYLLDTNQTTLDAIMGENIEILKASDTTTSLPLYNNKTFCGAVAMAFKKIQNRCTNARIVCVGMPYNADIKSSDGSLTLFNKIYECLEKVSFIFGVPFINLQNNMGVNASNLYSYFTDGVHPITTTKATNAMGNIITNQLKEVYPIEN